MSQMTLRTLSAAETRPLRQKILRPRQRIEDLVYEFDDHPETLHLGAFLAERQVGVLTIHPRKYQKEPDFPGAHWQLRGMAVEPDLRGMGVGKALYRRAEEHALATGATLIWCHARVGAKEFYLACGFTIESELYELPHAGRHYLMKKTF